MMSNAIFPAYCRSCQGNSQPAWSWVDALLVLASAATVPLFFAVLVVGTRVVLPVIILALVLAWYRPLVPSPKRGNLEYLWFRTAVLVGIALPLTGLFFAAFPF